MGCIPDRGVLTTIYARGVFDYSEVGGRARNTATLNGGSTFA